VARPTGHERTRHKRWTQDANPQIELPGKIAQMLPGKLIVENPPDQRTQQKDNQHCGR
jgi:hypothetical protein